MPGLVGLITKVPRARAEAELSRMLAAIRHESFYCVGTWSDESLGVYLGWTELPGAFSSGMPLRNASGDVCMVFSGDEYSEHRSEPDALSQAQYLVRSYEEDPDFIAQLNGMFHGVVADCRRGLVTVFNDRYGMHRLCYHNSGSAFYFAAEAKAILAVRPELRRIHPRSLGEFVACSCVLQDRTIFEDIQVLPAASAWTFQNAALQKRHTYFEPRQWESQSLLDDEAYYQQLRSSLLANLPRYFRTSQKMGIAMTGGLDTRVILANHRPAPGELPSYTFGGPFRESQDVKVGRRIAEICRQPHQVIQAGDEFLAAFSRYAERTVNLTEGTVDVNRASDLYVSEKARTIAPAKIVGTYGSEIVRHAVMFKPVRPLPGLFHSDFLPNIQQAEATYAALRQQHPVTFAAFRQSPWYHHGVLAIEKSQLSVHSPFMDNEFVRAVYRAPLGSATNGDVRLRLIKDASPDLSSVRSDRGVGGNGGLLISALTRAYQEFTFKAEYAYDYGMPQSLARLDHMFSGLHLERMFLGRHKLLHFRVWYRDQLAKYVRDVLLDSRSLSRPYVERTAVEAVVEGHLKGGLNYTSTIHKLLTLELIHRLFVDAR
jgi:asparagine synthase (glutamine-hydrolysing)